MTAKVAAYFKSIKASKRKDKDKQPKMEPPNKCLSVCFAELTAKQPFYSLYSCALIFLLRFDVTVTWNNGRQAGKDSLL
jgi:hypothetical protein